MDFDIENWLLSHRVGLTAAVIAIIWLFRIVVIRVIRERHVILREKDRRLMSGVRNVTFLLIFIAVVVLWLPQIQRFALSITAVAVAVVVATKEILSCMTGTLLRRVTSSFSIGDWIRINDTFGEVIEESGLATSLLEIDPRTYQYTGRTVTVPNSQFLTNTITNQNFLKRYVFVDISMTTPPEDFPIGRREELLTMVNAICSDFADTASRYNAMLERRTGVDIRNADTEIRFHTNETAMVVTTINVFCPTDRLVDIERQITEAAFKWYAAARRGPLKQAREDAPRLGRAANQPGANGVSD